MSQPIGGIAHPEPGPDLACLEPYPDAPSTLPSSMSHKDWAASCPEVYEEFKVKGQTVNARAKHCAFCGQPIRLSPRGDQALIEHMKSSACQARQRKLEGEIKNMAETTAKPSTSTSLTPNTPPRPSNPLFTPNLPVCQGAELVLSTSAWENYPWHIHGPSFVKGPSFYICSINRTGEILHVRSHSCTGFASQPGHPCCGACHDKLSSHELKSIVQRVHTEIPANGLNIQYYSYKQLVALIKTKDEELKKYRLKGLEINRKAERLLGKLNDRQHQDIHEL